MAAPASKRGPGLFVKGHDPRRNLRGRAAVPKVRTSDGRQVSLLDLFREYTEDAARMLAAVVRDTKEDTEVRVKAAAVILQRGWGDAPKEATLRLVTSDGMSSMTDEQLLEMAQRRIAAPVTVEGEVTRDA